MLNPLAPSRRSRLAALVAAGSLALTACGGDGDGAGSDLPADPTGAVGQALENSLEDTFAVTFSLEFSEGAKTAVVEEMGADLPAGVAEMLLDASLTLAGDTGQFGMGLTVGDSERFGFRALGDAFYMRVDVPWLGTVSGDALPPDLAEQAAGAAAFLGDLAPLIQPAIAGDWIGIDGVPADWQDQLGGIAESMGGVDVGATDGEIDYTDIDFPGLIADHVTATEVDGGYDVAINLRALATALAAELPESVMAADDRASIAELPETLTGIRVLLDGNKVTQVRLDGYSLAKSLDPDATDEKFGEGDVTIVMDIAGDAGDWLSEPGDAVTASFDSLVSTFGMLGGMMGGVG